MRPRAGFSEREHTADWELEVWAPDFIGLLEQAARGMVSISGIRLKNGPRQNRDIHLTALDRESLLVRFLAELLNLGEQEHLGFDVYQFALEGDRLSVVLEGAPIISQDKEIKAVTYHNLAIRETDEGLVVNIVFDV
jgi:protein archease